MLSLMGLPGVKRAQDRDLLAAAQARIDQLERALSERDGQDPVTGLLSLDRFRAVLEIEMDRARRHGRALSVAVVDIDGFRALNAHHGYGAGDAALKSAAHVLTRCTRSHDVTCRSGADEFVLLMPETPTDGGAVCIQRIIVELEAAQAGPISGLLASAGVAGFDRRHTPSHLIACAAEALDRARAAGGAQVKVAPVPAESAPVETVDAVAALSSTLGERDRYTGDHSESVVELAGGVARGLGVEDSEIHRIRIAALLHDLGKVAIPDEILHKPGKLDDDQWQLMRQHPVIGERILRAIPGLGGVARIVRHEHERWDGQGYPDGLSGTDIPLGSRIILACDAYHAMTSDRPYRAAMSHADAVGELLANAGTQFDPAVVEMLVGELYSLRQRGELPAA